MRLLVVDSEAISALWDLRSKKHQVAFAHVEAARGPRRRSAQNARIVVPTTVRVEAGWDRTATSAAAINRLGIIDHHLDAPAANVAARLRSTHGVSPADAHIGAVIQSADGDTISVLTSDDGDIQQVAEHVDVQVIHV